MTDNILFLQDKIKCLEKENQYLKSLLDQAGISYGIGNCCNRGGVRGECGAFSESSPPGDDFLSCAYRNGKYGFA